MSDLMESTDVGTSESARKRLSPFLDELETYKQDVLRIVELSESKMFTLIGEVHGDKDIAAKSVEMRDCIYRIGALVHLRQLKLEASASAIFGHANAR